jgi:hypothetical protein
MHRRYFLAVIATLTAASAARADIPLPDHLTYVDPQVAFDGIAENPDYVFYLRYLTFNGGPGNTPHTVVEVRDSKPFVLQTERRLMGMKLLAMKRTEFAKLANGQKSLDWLTDKTEGVLAAEFDEPSTVAPKKAKKPPLSTYRVQVKNGKLEVELVARTKLEETNSGGVLQNSMAGLALAGALASLGLLIMRRRNASRPQAVRK